MKLNRPVTFLAFAIACFAGESDTIPSSHERIRVVQQDISKWDRNADGKLTGAEREEFLKQKRKEALDAEAAARAAKLRTKPPKLNRARPSLSPEDVGKPIAKGVP